MDILLRTEQIRSKLKAEKDYKENPVDISLPVIGPFNGGGEIRVIILGQDPTVRNAASRLHITKTLNLDKSNAIRSYVNRICQSLGISIENIYATNVFKYFYTRPPSNTMHVLNSHLPENLKLLEEELYGFEKLPVISLGEPVLQLLTNTTQKVRMHWGYNKKTKKTNGSFSFVKAQDNNLMRDLYPFPHQPSLRKVFYLETMERYLQFVKQNKLLIC